MREAANLARVSFVHCQAVLAKEVLSETLPAGFEEITLQMAAPRCAALLLSPQCNGRGQLKRHSRFSSGQSMRGTAARPCVMLWDNWVWTGPDRGSLQA